MFRFLIVHSDLSGDQHNVPELVLLTEVVESVDTVDLESTVR